MRSEREFAPPFGAIIGSILGIVVWLAFILIYALDWSKGFSLFQDAIVTVVSLLIIGLAIGALWLVWFRVNGTPRHWWGRSDQTEIRRHRGDSLTVGQRSGELVSLFICLLILAFYAYHQAANTGFFTSKFGSLEMFALYGPIILSLVPPVARAVIGRRNPVRPVEAAYNVFLAFASLWLFTVFPFNFAYFADPLPGELRFLLAWVTNNMAKLVLVLAFLGGLISATYQVVRYLTFTLTDKTAEQPIHA